MSRRAPVAVSVALGVAAVTAVLLIGSSPSDRRSPDSEPRRVVAQDGGRPVQAPSTRDRTEQGARAAAITYATVSQDWLYLSDEQIDRSVRAISTPAAGPALSRQTVAELRTARDALARSPGRVWWFVRPLASRVKRFDATRARVVVWTVTVLSAADVALPQAEWLRVAVDQTWADGDWRLKAISDTPGPTPMTGTKDRPWQPEPFDDALGGFGRVGSAAGGS